MRSFVFDSMIPDMSYVVHIIPMLKCLVDIFVWFWGFSEIQCLWGVFGIHCLLFASLVMCFAFCPRLFMEFLSTHLHYDLFEDIL